MASLEAERPCDCRRHLGAEHEITHRTLNNLAAVMGEMATQKGTTASP